MNSFHPSLKFSLEKTDPHQNSTVPFLDTLITLTPTGQYSTELYFKPMASPIIIHFTSAQPMQVKLAVLNSELLRAKRTGSNEEAIERGIDKVTKIFLSNGYPMRIIKRAIFKVRHPGQPDHKRRRDEQNQNTTFISLPFIDDDLTRKINAKVRSSELPIKIAWQKGKTVSSVLVRSALNPPECPSGNKTCYACEAGVEGECTTKNVVYHIKCVLCNSDYIGETKRPLRLRFNEHLRDSKNRTKDIPFGDHMRQHHSDAIISASSLRVRILRRCKDVAYLKITESKCIRDLKPKLNTQTSSWKILSPPPYGSD